MAQVPTGVSNNPALVPAQDPQPEAPVGGYNFLRLGNSNAPATGTATATASLPSSPVDLEQARRSHEEFIAERLAAAESVLGGARSNLEQTRKTQEENKLSWTMSSWFSGGLRTQLIEQEKAEAKYVHASEEKVAELKKREALSQQLMLTSQQLTQQAQQLDGSGNAARATEARAMATQLLELTPAVLEAPKEVFASIATRTERALTALSSGPAGAAAARESLALARGVAAQWKTSIDPDTGKRPRASAIADTKDLQKGYRDVNKAIQESFVVGNRTEYVVLTAVVITVGVVAATVATGGLALPVMLGGATIGTGLVGGTILGILAGTAVGAAAAYGEALGNLRYGKSWDEVSGKAAADTKSHFWTAASSVGFGKLAQGVGFVIGKFGAVGRWALTPLKGVAEKIPSPIRRILSPWGARGMSALPAGVSSGAITVADGIHAQMKADEKFQVWAHAQPHLDPHKKDFNVEEYYKAWQVYREANHITNGDVLWQAARNTLISGTSALAHAGPQKVDTFTSRVLRNGKGMGIGVATEAGVDMFRQTVEGAPLGKPVDPLAAVDEADAMGITWAHMWGSIMGRSQNRAYYGPPAVKTK